MEIQSRGRTLALGRDRMAHPSALLCRNAERRDDDGPATSGGPLAETESVFSIRKAGAFI